MFSFPILEHITKKWLPAFRKNTSIINKIDHRRYAVLGCLGFFLAGCVQVVPYDHVERMAVESLRTVQKQSIAEQREYCGWVYLHDGVLAPSQIVPGKYDRCQMPTPPKGARIVASFHTHGNHSPYYYSELPSGLDIEREFNAGIYGFVATPGGRVWVIDPFEQSVVQLCDVGCLPKDPNYEPSDHGYIAPIYTRDMIYGPN